MVLTGCCSATPRAYADVQASINQNAPAVLKVLMNAIKIGRKQIAPWGRVGGGVGSHGVSRVFA